MPSLLQNPWIANLLAIVAGSLTTLSLAPFELWPLGLLSCALFAWLLQDCSAKQCALRGWSYGLGLFASGASWVYVSIHSYGNAPVALAALLTVLFAMGLALFWSIPAWLYGRFFRLNSDRALLTALGFAAFFVVGEWWRSWMLTGFPWLYVGYAHLDTPLAGWAPVIGIYGLGFIIAFSAAAVLAACRRQWSPLIVASCLWLIGAALTQTNWTTQSDREPLKIAMVQANIPQDIKWQRDQYWPTLKLYQRLSQPLWSTADIVLWPEAAIPGTNINAKNYLDKISRLAKDEGSSLITGLPYREDPDSRQYFNSALALGTGSGVYHKQRLVPFGEYVPLESWLRGLIDFFDLPMSAFSAGPEPQPQLLANGVSLAPFICYEIVYPDLVAAAGDSDILITLSNDAWFGDSIGPKQHLQMAQMRALENGRYLLRATSAGGSAIIDPRGHILKRSAAFKRGTLQGEARVMSGTTPFGITGSKPILLLSAAILAALVFRRRQQL